MPFPDLPVLMTSPVRKSALVSSRRCSRCVFSSSPCGDCFVFGAEKYKSINRSTSFTEVGCSCIGFT